MKTLKLKIENQNSVEISAGNIIVDNEGTEWEVRLVSQFGLELQNLENDEKGEITWSEFEEFDFTLLS